MGKELGILDLLTMLGYQQGKADKLVRHADQRIDLIDLFRRGWLEAYQAHQGKDVFEAGSQIISFVGLEGRRSRFFGVFKVIEALPRSKLKLPAGCPPGLDWQNASFFYRMERLEGFEALEDRVVIDWSGSVRAWHQYVRSRNSTRNMPVIEILPPGPPLPPFKDYLDFTLTYPELQYIFRHEHSTNEWRARLQAVAGIYLILNSTTGHQYVGCAGGVDGIWGRWASYAQTGHGGNVTLKKLVQENSGAPQTFTFSLLQVVPKTTTKTELYKLEQRFKKKLGTLATGLNEN